MLTSIRTDSQSKEFCDLVKLLDADLKIRDGEDHTFYSQFNKVDMIKYAVVIYEDHKPIGCGAIKQYDDQSMEVKRMYVVEASRGKGVAVKILNELEGWAKEIGFARCVLETGKKQPEAIRLYQKCGYAIIPNYGQYAGVENSVCFEKLLGL